MSAQPTTAEGKPALAGAKPSLISLIRRDRAWIIMMILPMLYFALFRYLPLYGMVIAFKDYSVGRGIWSSEWVGLKWFLQFFNSFYFWRLVRNTFLISFYMLLFGFPVPILFALCLNEVRAVGFRRTVQTVSYLPYFISVVVVVGIMVNFVSINGGIINVIIARLGGTPVNFMNEVGWFRPMYVLSEIWQDFGFGSIIYLAAIAGIDEELYDAAEVDGCSRWQRIRYVTLPGISATIIILLILRPLPGIPRVHEPALPRATARPGVPDEQQRHDAGEGGQRPGRYGELLEHVGVRLQPLPSTGNAGR